MKRQTGINRPSTTKKETNSHRAKPKKINEQAKELKEKISNIKENFHFRFRSVWMGSKEWKSSWDRFNELSLVHTNVTYAFRSMSKFNHCWQCDWTAARYCCPTQFFSLQIGQVDAAKAPSSLVMISVSGNVSAHTENGSSPILCFCVCYHHWFTIVTSLNKKVDLFQ